MAALEVNVWWDGRWYGPSYPGAGELPVGDLNIEPPPKAGPGSSKAKWAEYAEDMDVDVPDGADRDGIIAACEAAGVPA